MMYNNVECYYEPRGILAKMSEPYVEMSPFEHGFLCGLIKSNNPKKIVALKGYGLKINDVVKLNPEINSYNEKYMNTKKEKMNHMF